MGTKAATGTLRVGNLRVEIYEDAAAMGKAAANSVAGQLRKLAEQMETVAVIFATGISQVPTLEALIASPGLPWQKVIGFHMDEYIGISDQHPASFRRYLRERLTDKVQMARFYGINGNPGDPQETARDYAAMLRRHHPQLCLLGIGENGHLAFNDPPEANFQDSVDMKIVSLDEQCRQQQVNEGWFSSIADVPSRALTLTIPALMRVPRLIVSVPGERKAEIVRRTLTEEVSTACPATILRRHPDATVYLDLESAAELPFRSAQA